MCDVSVTWQSTTWSLWPAHLSTLFLRLSKQLDLLWLFPHLWRPQQAAGFALADPSSVPTSEALFPRRSSRRPHLRGQPRLAQRQELESTERDLAHIVGSWVTFPASSLLMADLFDVQRVLSCNSSVKQTATRWITKTRVSPFRPAVRLYGGKAERPRF